MGQLDVTIVTVALPRIAAELHAGLTDLQWGWACSAQLRWPARAPPRRPGLAAAAGAALTAGAVRSGSRTGTGAPAAWRPSAAV